MTNRIRGALQKSRSAIKSSIRIGISLVGLASGRIATASSSVAAASSRAFTFRRRERVLTAEEPQTLPHRENLRSAPKRDKTADRVNGATARWIPFAGYAFLGILLLQLSAWLMDLYARSPVLAAGGAVCVFLLIVCLFGAVRIEIESIARLKSAVAYQEKFAEPHDSDNDPQQRLFLRQWLSLIEISSAEKALLEEKIALASTSNLAVDLVEDELLRGLDRIALQKIRDAVAQTFGLVALSPTTLTDTILFLWRALRVVREVAQVYGLRPSYFGSLWLLRQVVSDAALIAAADLMSDAVATVLGDKLVARLSSPLAQGSVAMYRMARFGLLTVQRCRPIPFRQNDQLGLYAVFQPMKGMSSHSVNV